MKTLSTLSNFQIDKRLGKFPNYGYCISKDEIVGKSHDKVWVVNAQSSDQGGGTHWTMVYPMEKDNSLLWFDSFGYPPSEIARKWMKSSGKKCLYSDIQLQDLMANSCGWWCEMMIQELERGRHFLDIAYSFTNNTQRNEQLLRQYFSS